MKNKKTGEFRIALNALVRLGIGMRQIRTLHDLHDLRDERRSVVCPAFAMLAKPRPAAFVLNFSGEIILRCIKSGMFMYEKKSNVKHDLQGK